MTHNIDIPEHLSFDTSTYTWITFFFYILQSQYKFLYRVLYESFRTGSHLWPKDNFVQEVGTEMQTDKAVNLSNLRREFKVVTKLAYVLTFFVTQSNKLYASPIVHYEIKQLIINYSCFI